MKNSCDYYEPKNINDIVNCPNCTRWDWDKAVCNDRELVLGRSENKIGADE